MLPIVWVRKVPNDNTKLPIVWELNVCPTSTARTKKQAKMVTKEGHASAAKIYSVRSVLEVKSPGFFHLG